MFLKSHTYYWASQDLQKMNTEWEILTFCILWVANIFSLFILSTVCMCCIMLDTILRNWALFALIVSLLCLSFNFATILWWKKSSALQISVYIPFPLLENSCFHCCESPTPGRQISFLSSYSQFRMHMCICIGNFPLVYSVLWKKDSILGLVGTSLVGTDTDEGEQDLTYACKERRMKKPQGKKKKKRQLVSLLSAFVPLAI